MQLTSILGIYLLRCRDVLIPACSHVKVSDVPGECISGIHHICFLR